MMEYNHRTGRHRPRDQYLADLRGPNGENLVHGNETGYNRGCRCELCKEAGAQARRERRKRNPEARMRENQKRMERYYAQKAEA